MKYARTVITSHDFEVQNDFLAWHFTCHHKDARLMEFAEQFSQLQEMNRHQIFSVWGHSFEFDGENNWEILEDLCRFMSKQTDVLFLTNIEAYQLVK